MKKLSSGTLIALATVLVAACALAQSGAVPAVRLSPENLSWKAVGNGAEQAVIVGDDANPGLYSYQGRIPSGTKVAPHYHSGDRVVVVISGTFYVGFGDRFDAAAMKALPAGERVDRTQWAGALRVGERRRSRASCRRSRSAPYHSDSATAVKHQVAWHRARKRA